MKFSCYKVKKCVEWECWNTENWRLLPSHRRELVWGSGTKHLRRQHYSYPSFILFMLGLSFGCLWHFFQGQTHFFVGRILCYVYFIPSAEFKMIVLCEYCSCMQKLKSFSLYDQKEEFVFGCDQGLEKGIVIFWLQFARFQSQGYTLATQSDCHALKHNTRSVI